jgi:Flp pilus assembly protein TadD/outer membrane protein OmpA-like peptidoglycan-associated protein
MKAMKSVLKSGLLLAAMSLLLMGCNCYNKMQKKVGVVTSTSVPAVLTLQGKEVKSTYTVEFPANYFNKKATLRITPVLVFESGELAGTPSYAQGSKVRDNYTVIGKNGGKITQSVTFPYSDKMKQSTLKLRIDAKCKNGEFQRIAEIELANGVSTVQELADLGGQPAIAPDNFQRNTVISQQARILFLINSANVRPGQLTNDEVKALEKFIAENTGDAKKTVNDVNIRSFASPDGPVKLNDRLSQDRARNTESALDKKYAKKPLPGNLGFEVEALGEDWEGFRELVQQSDIPDKNLILQVLNMYTDSERRDAEIHNMSAAFSVLKEKILPELRRSKMQVNVDVAGLTDAELRAAVSQNLNNLNLEEMLFAATLFDNNAEKQRIYKAAADKYNDFRAWNNYAATLLKEGKAAEAAAALTKAAGLNNSSNEVINNLGLAALAQGNTADARRYLTSIASADAKYNAGLLNLTEGNYAQAAQGLDGYNLAVAEVLNGNLPKAKQLLQGAGDSAKASYLKAVIAAREGDSIGVISNLKSVAARDSKLAAQAKKDIEFSRWFGVAEFIAL